MQGNSVHIDSCRCDSVISITIDARKVPPMIRVFEGPLCCNTGVCGTDPDQALVDFTADVNWLTRQGVEVRRANLSQDPAAFAESPIARAFVQKVGAEGLPLVVVDDVTVVTGRYPSRVELARIAGVHAPGAKTETACCGGPEPATSSVEASSPSCCGGPSQAGTAEVAANACGADSASSCGCSEPPRATSTGPRSQVHAG